ncbi:hypothetical protein D3C81_742220 [compost metagenome]
MVNMQARPWLASPTSQPVAPSKFITQVDAPLMPILCSSAPQLKALRSPRVPSAFTSTLGTRNRLMPLTPGGASGKRASTRWIMLALRSCSPPLMKILLPLSW